MRIEDSKIVKHLHFISRNAKRICFYREGYGKDKSRKSRASVEYVNNHRKMQESAKLQEQVMPGVQLEHPKDCGKHARRGNDFSRTTGKCTAAPQTRRSVGKRSEDVCNDTCISGTIGRATDYHVVRKHSSEVLIAGKYLIKPQTDRRVAGRLKKRCTEEEKLFRPETYGIFHVFKSLRERKKNTLEYEGPSIPSQ